MIVDAARERDRRLLDREPRPDGRPHRRLVDGRAAADARRPDVPAAPRRRVRDRARGRRRHGRRERAVRGAPRDARGARDRDEPARLPLVGARVEGDRRADREARGAARGRVHARRAAERHHRHGHGRVRARARLRRGEGAAVRVREVPAGRSGGSAPRCARSARRSASGARSPRRSSRRSRAARRRRSPFDECAASASRSRSGGTCCSRRRGAGSTCRASTRTSPTGCASSPRRRPASGRPRRLAVDSCAGEFDARTPYYYVTHEGEDEGPPPSGRAVIVLGGGPNRIGQAIEFDYCCVHAARALRTLGYEAVLVNSNPETVSTDYDSCDRLYLEPLTAERVLEICELEQPVGVAVSFGGQTPLGLAPALEAAGVPLLGDAARRDRRGGGPRRASPRSRASSRRRGAAPRTRRRRARSRSGSATRCSSGRTTSSAGAASTSRAAPTSCDVTGPCLVDRFLEGALELDVDALCDGEDAWVAAILEHVEPVGAHSGDSACVIPAPSVTPDARGRDPGRRLDRRARPRRPGPAQPPARGARASPVRARGEPARVAHRAVRGEGDRGAARRARGAAAARRAARRARPPGTGRADARLGEGGGLPGRALPGRGRARARDAIDRRGHGRRAHRRARPTRGRSARPGRSRRGGTVLPPLQAARQSQP